MELQQFEMVMKRLQGLINSCEVNTGFIKSKEDLANLPLKDVITVVEHAKRIQGQMDVIVGTELYHILGMGNLSMMQQYLFIEKIKELLSHRSYIKVLAGYNVPTIPTIPDTSAYTCKVLGAKLKYEFE